MSLRDSIPPAAVTPDPKSLRAGAGSELPLRCVCAALGCLLVFGVAQYGRLGTPLFWQDEAETAMFGRRVLEHGYPKVHGDEGVVYGMSVPMAYATDAASDAYTGSLWAQYYVAAAGVALSQLADDLHARTAWVRLPFALLGSAGLALAWWAFAPAFDGRARRWAMGSAYCLGLATSVSLQLHLREARYYALVVFCVGGLLFAWQRATGMRRDVGVFAGLFVLFNSFYPAAVAMGAWLVLEPAWGALRARPRPRAWPRELARAAAPVASAFVAAVPVALWFGMWPLSRLMSARYHFGPADYFANLVVLTRHLLQHELLLAALLLRGAVAAVALRPAARAREPLAGTSLAPALWRLALIWALIGARNPIFFERYFVALGPLLLLAALLDFERLRRLLERDWQDARRRQRALAALAGVCVAGALALKAPELAGRIAELRTPVAGPLDVAIPWVAARFEAPGEIVVATNYENEAWMFYLGSRVVGGFHAGSEVDARAEAEARPDVVVPRRGYPHTFAQLRGYLTPGDFERFVLDAPDLPYNTIPELSAGRVLKQTHPFESPAPRHEDEALWVWVRRAPGDAPR